MKIPKWMGKTLDFLLKVWFPSHHRKITRTVVAVGAALLLDGYLLDGLLQWLVRFAVAEFSGMPTPEWSEVSGDAARWPGVVVIGLGLLFSVIVLLIETYSSNVERREAALARAEASEREKNSLQRDYIIYKKFLDDFASGRRLDEFVCHHNFGSSWSFDCSTELHNFICKWSTPEMCFLDAEISNNFLILLKNMSALAEHLVTEAGPLEVNSERLCIFEPSRHHEMDLPKHIEDAIQEANRLGCEVRKDREAFILMAEKHFSVLP